SVIDPATNKPLKFEVVTAAQAKVDDPNARLGSEGQFIRVHLAHPVPERGEYRLAIIKTYKDDKSYYTEGDQIVYKRPLGIPRDSVVLPVGYEIVSCSVATQVLREADGRLKLAFVNPGSGGQLEVTIRAKKLKSGATIAPVRFIQNQNPLTERAYQDREILYELQAPDSHAFRITHDYTVRRTGEKYYFNVVRA